MILHDPTGNAPYKPSPSPGGGSFPGGGNQVGGCDNPGGSKPDTSSPNGSNPVGDGKNPDLGGESPDGSNPQTSRNENKSAEHVDSEFLKASESVDPDKKAVDYENKKTSNITVQGVVSITKGGDAGRNVQSITPAQTFGVTPTVNTQPNGSTKNETSIGDKLYNAGDKIGEKIDNFVRSGPYGKLDAFMKGQDTHVDVGIKGEIGVGPNSISFSIGGTSAAGDHTDFFVSVSTSTGVEKGSKKPSNEFSGGFSFFINASNSDVPASGKMKTTSSSEVGGQFGNMGVSHKKSSKGSTEIGINVGPKTKTNSVKGSVKTTSTYTVRSQ